MSKDWIDELLDGADWGYHYRVSDYATTKEEELEYIRVGKQDVERIKQQIRDKIERIVENQEWHRTIGEQ